MNGKLLFYCLMTKHYFQHKRRVSIKNKQMKMTDG